METEETAIEQSRSVEDLHSLRLRALLHELVRKHGPKGAAKSLEIDHRTLLASMEERDLSRRVRVALEKALLSDADAAAARQRERIEALEQRVEALAEEAHSSLEAIGGEIRALREAHAQGMRQFERRLAAAEAGRRDQGAAGRKLVGVVRERRLHPELVTREPAPGDEDAYGPAWPLIDEWRKLRAGHPGRGSGVSWLAREERIRELELAMLEEHRLTLPPATQPRDDSTRRSEVYSLRRTLARVHAERVRAQSRRWARRVLTLGLWWP